ncbi:MAG TPA: hypothetical protein VL356_04235 [Acidocella sp.]|nr:hypothetical protein [Acidocella sp.]
MDATLRGLSCALSVDARRIGIKLFHQDFARADDLTAASNIFPARALRRRGGFVRVMNQAAL